MMLVALVVVSLPVASGMAQEKTVTLEDAVRMALEHAPELRIGAAEIERSRSLKASARGQMGPKLGLDASVQQWNKAQDVTFTLPPELGIQIPAMRVQDQRTSALSLSVTQPITPLYSLYQLYRVQGAGQESARLENAATRDAVRFRVTEAFFRLRSAMKLSEVAQKAVETIEAHLKTAQSFQAAGVVGRDDVLRAETALANARDGLNQAQAGVALARSSLNLQMGWATNDLTLPSGNDADPPPEVSLTEEQAIEKGLANRSDLRAMQERVRMAGAGHQAAIGAMLPTISARFQYNHQEGNSFAESDMYFVGGFLTWNFWEWGSTWYQVDAAAADEQKAQEAVQGMRDAITLDVKRSWLDLKTAWSSIATWRKGIESSEENLRVVNKKYEASTATSVEVLDAQSSMTQSNSHYHVALAAYYTALANLKRAMGEP